MPIGIGTWINWGDTRAVEIFFGLLTLPFRMLMGLLKAIILVCAVALSAGAYWLGIGENDEVSAMR